MVSDLAGLKRVLSSTESPMPAEQGRRQSYSDQAYTLLRRKILDNEISAGLQATEQEIAEALGMSRTPVREALVRLANEGLVEVRPRHGMRVLPVSGEDMREIYEILTGLETVAAESVARRGLTDAQSGSLEQAVADMDIALENGDLRAWAEADERFHMLLVDFCGNRRLRTLVGTYWDQAHRVRMITLRLRPKPTKSSADHAELLDALRRGDGEAASRIHREHREGSGKMLIEILETHGLTAL